MRVENGILFTKILVDFAESEDITDLMYKDGAILLNTIDSWYDVTDSNGTELKVVTDTNQSYTIQEHFSEFSKEMKKYLTEYKPYKVSN